MLIAIFLLTLHPRIFNGSGQLPPKTVPCLSENHSSLPNLAKANFSMSLPPRYASNSKRSPSILVTDVRNQRGHSAPFVRRLDNVSVDKVLSNTSDIPSARQRVTRPQNPQVRPVPRLYQGLPSRASKNSQRLVLIPDEDQQRLRTKETGGKALVNTDLEYGHHSVANVDQNDIDRYPRVTSYFIAEGYHLEKVADYLKKWHKARVRLYDEVLFADYLLPLQPGDGYQYRAQSSLGDNRRMERMIDISEQGDHHYEYFSSLDGSSNEHQSGMNDDEFDPSEPQDFSPRPSVTLESMAATSSESEDDVDAKKSAAKRDRKLQQYMSHAEIFVFSYGVIVFWNFSEEQEKSILADLTIGGRKNLAIRPRGDQDIETENLLFHYAATNDEKPHVFNDIITLTNNNHMIKLAMSHAAAQSTKLCGFEDRMQTNMHDVKNLPKILALTGRLGLNREQVLQFSGKLFKLRVDVNLSSNVLDTPEFFWTSEPSLYPLYAAIREYLEIDQRILVLNERCSVFLEFTSVLADTVAEFNMDRITIVMIILIVFSIFVSLTEIGERYLLLSGKSHKEVSETIVNYFTS